MVSTHKVVSSNLTEVTNIQIEEYIMITAEVLLLNKAWRPVTVLPPCKAIKKLYKGVAKALDSNYVMHDWDSWISMDWDIAKKEAQNIIRSATLSVVIPKIIVLSDYDGFVRRRITLNRKNLYKRDNGQCQYCGIKTNDYADYNIEHVIPTSRGGKNVWSNLVLACLSCNNKKGNRNLKDTNLKLIRKPFIPKWNHMYQGEIKKNYDDWSTLLGDLYWNVKLEK
jgi:5-methylcytosine-specific restriction endonuclease McrA